MHSLFASPWVDPWGTHRNRGGMVQFWYCFFFSVGEGSWVLETTLVEHGNIEDLYFESLGISEQASNAPGQFHWCFPCIFLSWLSASSMLMGTLQLHSMPMAKLDSCVYFKAKAIFGIAWSRFGNKCLMLSEKSQWEMSGKLDANFRLPGTYFENLTRLPATSTVMQLFK